MKLNKISAFFAALLLLGATACSDDIKTPLTEIQGGEEVESYTSLTFKWNKVPGAVQYGYQLFLDDETSVETGVTADTKAVFSNLVPDTEYTLKVWAYADPNGSQTTSEPIVLKARTKATTLLATPEVQSMIEGKYVNVYWDDVPDATSYKYSLTLGDKEIESGTVTDPSLWFYGLEAGTYTATVQALNSKESYSDSKEGVGYITITRTKIWEAKGIYKSGLLNTSWETKIFAYSDNTYSIRGFYQGNGYNLDFYIDSYYPDNAFVLDDSQYEYDDNSGYYKVPTGRYGLSTVWVYPWYNDCSMQGDKDNGVVSLDVYGSGNYATDTFIWGDAATESPADDFVGIWTMTISGQSAINDDWDFKSYSKTSTVEITKVDDTTISLPALYFGDTQMSAKVDMQTRTVTVKPLQVSAEGYNFTLAGTATSTTAITGTIQGDGSIVFNDFTAWYGTSAYYLYEMKATLTRQ